MYYGFGRGLWRSAGPEAMIIMVTGGAGFIGGAVVRMLIGETDHQVVVVDKLTYAGNLDSLRAVLDSPRLRFIEADICNQSAMVAAFSQHRPDLVMHLAAESHVDRSIDRPADFIDTNIVGTYTLLDVALARYRKLDGEAKARFRFHHISTDEVFGSLGDSGFFREDTPYQPRSPYAASKAASDHLVRAWHETYGLPVVLSNCSNNYGPYQFPEKLIPLTILNALAGRALPVYGTGENVRDWLYVDDHARGLIEVAMNGRTGESYNIGGLNERRNIDVVTSICQILDRIAPHPDIADRRELIQFVTDRPGHDQRYAIDCAKIGAELGWRPSVTFDEGLETTIRWYMDNEDWWRRIQSGTYRGERLGLARESAPVR